MDDAAPSLACRAFPSSFREEHGGLPDAMCPGNVPLARSARTSAYSGTKTTGCALFLSCAGTVLQAVACVCPWLARRMGQPEAWGSAKGGFSTWSECTVREAANQWAEGSSPRRALLRGMAAMGNLADGSLHESPAACRALIQQIAECTLVLSHLLSSLSLGVAVTVGRRTGNQQPVQTSMGRVPGCHSKGVSLT